jgi:hypothetical protein
MPVILVLEDDSATRNALVDALRHLFAGVRVASARSDAAPGVIAVERPTVVLASPPALERLGAAEMPDGLQVVALTREMSPDTLLKGETLGLAGALRVPAQAEQLATVLGPMLGIPPR